MSSTQPDAWQGRVVDTQEESGPHPYIQCAYPDRGQKAVQGHMRPLHLITKGSHSVRVTHSDVLKVARLVIHCYLWKEFAAKLQISGRSSFREMAAQASGRCRPLDREGKLAPSLDVFLEVELTPGALFLFFFNFCFTFTYF